MTLGPFAGASVLLTAPSPTLHGCEVDTFRVTQRRNRRPHRRGSELARAAPRSGRAKPSLFRPKCENDLSAYLLHELRLRLSNSEVVINREVQVDRKPGGFGNRTDLLIQAFPRKAGQRVTASYPVSVVIEVKGNSNRKLYTAMHEQLVEPSANSRRCSARPGRRSTTGSRSGVAPGCGRNCIGSCLTNSARAARWTGRGARWTR